MVCRSFQPERAVLLHQGAEFPVGEAVAHEVGGRGHGGEPLPAVDERDLPEVVAGAEGGDLLAADGHAGFARVDDVERGAAGALADHGVTRGELPRLAERRDSFDVVVGQLGEQRHRGQHVGGIVLGDRRGRVDGGRLGGGRRDRSALEEVHGAVVDRPLDVASIAVGVLAALREPVELLELVGVERQHLGAVGADLLLVGAAVGAAPDRGALEPGARVRTRCRRARHETCRGSPTRRRPLHRVPTPLR